MKRLLFIIVLISIAFLSYGQREKDLPLRASSTPSDTVRVLQNGSSIMLRSVLQSDIYDSLSVHTDTLQALRADIDAGLSADLSDSIAAHRIELDNHTDSINAHRTELDNHTDSLAVHRTELDNLNDSITDHRTDIDANTSQIATNGTNISTNSVNIIDNTNDISDLQDSITKHTDTLQLHQDRIAALDASNYWDRTGTDLTPTTAGDDILLDVGTGRLSYGNGNGYIYAPLNTSLIIGADGGNVITVDGAESIIASNWRPNLNSVWRLGNESRFWEATFTDSIYIDNTSNFISEDGSNNMSFTDAVTGTKTLAELAASAPDSSWTSIAVDTITEYTTDHGVLIESIEFEDKIISYDDGPSQRIRFDHDDVSLRLEAWSATGFTGNSATLLLTGGQFSLFAFDGSNTKSFEVSASAMTISDGQDSQGLIYAADYSANYTDRSLVDKEYVDAPAVISHSLTDGAPTDAQIDSATGTTPAAVGSGWKTHIFDSDGSALMYIIISDGTNWQYTAMTIAL